jgi:hypothetical protein
MRFPEESPYNTNGAVVFDYKSPTDFKFVSVHARNGRMRIGQRDGEDWKFLADYLEPQGIASETDHRITVSLIGSVASVTTGGKTRLTYNFGVPLSGGRVGLGSRAGEASFDDFSLEKRIDEEDFEYVELTNTTEESVDVSGWALAGGIEATLPAGTVIGGGASLVVAGFAAGSDAVAEEFRRVLGVATEVVVLPLLEGRLDNQGESVRLLRPLESGDGPLVVVDAMSYGNRHPWPASADGGGHSLLRRSADSYGGVRGTWLAGPPSPGEFHTAVVGDMNLDGRLDMDDLGPLVESLRDVRAYEATYGVPPSLAGDVDGDGDLDFDDLGDLAALLASHLTSAVGSSARAADSGAVAADAADSTLSSSVDSIGGRVSESLRKNPRHERMKSVRQSVAVGTLKMRETDSVFTELGSSGRQAQRMKR